MTLKYAELDDDSSVKFMIFGLNGRCFMVTLITLSIAVNVVLYHYNNEAEKNKEDESNDLPYAADHEDFLQIVEPTYSDDQLVKWEPPPKVKGDPSEPGYMGKPVVVPPEMQELAKEREKENYFNVVASEMVPANRTIDDYRARECSYVPYPEKLPQTSVIIVFRNEAWSTLIRTIWSVYTKSPRALLKEIILVDDKSNHTHLGKQLDDFVKTMPVKTLLLRSISRRGLMQARLLGVKYARAPTITFLDSHCECNDGWLEPLLARVAQNRQAAVTPTIDMIAPETFEYQARDESQMYGAFSWTLQFKWAELPAKEMERINFDRAGVIRVAAMAGGLFTIDKEFFLKVGGYDEQMRIWGSENIEMSIRLWSCGGSVETAQCSRVGHVFRATSPHSFPGGTETVLFGNEARLVDVWLDEFSEFYYSLTPDAQFYRTDVSERLRLRKQLKCKSFRWYLENVYPDSILLQESGSSLKSIESVALPGVCIDSFEQTFNSTMHAESCHYMGGHQVFLITKNHEIRSDDLCLDATRVGDPVTLWPCHNLAGHQKWVYNNKTKTFQHFDGKNCLTVSDERVHLDVCNGSVDQQWILENVREMDREVMN